MNTIMKNISKFLLLSLFVFVAAGCEQDFLDVTATDSIEESTFWESETQARSYMYGLYMYMFPGYSAPSTVTGLYEAGQFLIRYQSLDYVKYNAAFNDDWAMVKQYELYTDPATTSSNWSNFYKKIRLTNYAIANAHRLPSNAKHWEGVARFFRAAYYSDMTFLYGDVPYFDEVSGLADAGDMANYCKARTPRAEIDAAVIKDFKYAMENCAAYDGYCQVNKYVAAAMASRMMLREGTFLKYVVKDDTNAKICLAFAKEAAEFVINSGVYSIAPDFNAIFTSDNLESNPEVIMSRAYATGQLLHSTLAVCYNYDAISENKNGASKSLAEAFLGSNGLPIVTNYSADKSAMPKSADEFFANRDPRLALTIRPRFSFDGTDQGGLRTAASGYMYNKFFNDAWLTDGTDLTQSQYKAINNITDAPCVRYAEVLLNYIETIYELQLLGQGSMTQADLDKTINAIRDREGIKMPHVTLAGDHFEVNSVAVDDPKRAAIEAKDMANGGSYTTDAILWEIRRERRVELAYEGTRFDDLKRWGKLNYVCELVNPDISYGAYMATPIAGYETRIGTGDFANFVKASDEVRPQPDKKYYYTPLPSDQVVFYEKHGYTLAQNPGF